MSSQNINIEKFFQMFEENIQQLTDKNPQEKTIVNLELRYTLNKMYKNIKILAEKYNVSYRVPRCVKEIINLNNYEYKPLGKHDWIIYTNKGEFIYLDNKGKWYLAVNDVYETKEFGKSIKQEELISILTR